MNIEKINVTLYDLIGYLLPGFVLLIGCSLLEATFSNTHLLTLTQITANPLVFAIPAYFLGHACHAIGSWLKEMKPAAFRMERCMNPAVHNALVEEVHKAYGLSVGSLNSDVSDLETYLLADNYVVASGGSTERDIFQAREGFFKASFVAFTLLFLILVASLFVGGTRIQSEPRVYTTLSLWMSAFVAGTALMLAWLWWKRLKFFACLKRNNTLILFLAIRKKAQFDSKDS